MQIAQEAGQVCGNPISLRIFHSLSHSQRLWYIKVDVFLELSCFFDDLSNVGNLISGFSGFEQCEYLEVLGSHTVEVWLGEL